MRRALAGAIAAAVLALVPAAAGAQQSGVTGYDGANPFGCTLQQVGTGTDFPYPDADPFCVEFDKRSQNITQLGIVDFISKEPARVAAAVPKCFYFQRDHWRGSVDQAAGPVIYEFDGSYFFDKARGRGGVHLDNFKIAGQTSDPSQLPGFPADWKPYFGPGRGGVQASGEVPADPSCGVAPAPETPPPAATAEAPQCRAAGGIVGDGIGGISLGATRKRVESLLGKPSTASTSAATWCLDDGHSLSALFAGDRVKLVLTDSPPFDWRNLRVGLSAHRARLKLRGEKTLGTARGARVLAVRERRRQLIVGVARSRVTFVAVATPGARALSLLRDR